MDMRKIIFLIASALFFATVVSAQQNPSNDVVVDGLEFEEVNPDFKSDSIEFSTSYMNQSLAPSEVFVPDELRPALEDGSFQYELTTWDGYNNDGEVVSEEAVLNVGFQFQNAPDIEYTYPDENVSRLIGNDWTAESSPYPQHYFDSYQQSTASIDNSSEARVFDFEFSDDGGEYTVGWDIQVSSHYEHLLIEYDLVYNETGQEAEVIHSFEDVYSGERPEKLTVGGDAVSTGENTFEKNISYDNLYRNDTSEVAYFVVPENSKLVGVDFRGLNHTEIEYNHSSAVDELQAAEINQSMILDSVEGLETVAYNVSFPEDSVRTITAEYEFNDYKRESGGSVAFTETPEFFSYIIGSGGAITYDSSTTLCGEVTNTDGELYDTITIESGTTVSVCDSEGWVNLTANDEVIVDGVIDGAGVGEAGGSGAEAVATSGGRADPGEDGFSGAGAGAGGGGGGSGGSTSEASGGGGAGFFSGGATGTNFFTSGGSGGGSYSLATSLIGSGGGGGAAAFDSGSSGEEGDSVGGGNGGNGGAGVFLRSPEITISGTVNIDGYNGGSGYWSISDLISYASGGGGGGSGGGLIVEGDNVEIVGSIYSRGGDGGGYKGHGDAHRAGGGGGGSGGVIEIYYTGSLNENLDTLALDEGSSADGTSSRNYEDPNIDSSGPGDYTTTQVDSLSFIDPPVVNMFNWTDGGLTEGATSLTANVTDPEGFGVDFAQFRVDRRTNFSNESVVENNLSEATDGSAWLSYETERTFDEPIVLANSNTENDAESPKVAQIRNVDGSGFEYRMCELENGGDCDSHSSENLGLGVFEKSSLNSLEGVEAGKVTVSPGSDSSADAMSVEFSEGFENSPVAVATQNTHNNGADQIVMLESVSTSGFDIYQCNFDSSNQDECLPVSESEEVSYLAVDPVSNELSSEFEFEAGFYTGEDSNWITQSFDSSFSSTPVGFSVSATNNGGQQPHTTAIRNVGTTGMDVRFCEFDGGDTCDGHATEDVAWMAFNPESDLEAEVFDVETVLQSENASEVEENIFRTSSFDLEPVAEYVGVFEKAADINGTVSSNTERIVSERYTNPPPEILNTTFVDDRVTGVTELYMGIEDNGQEDISSFSGISEASLFTNTSLQTGIDLPFSSTVSVSDFQDASDSVDVNISEVDSGLQQHDFNHSLGVQRVNQTVTVFNDAGSSIGYELYLDLPGNLVQGQDWNGSVPASSNVTHTGVSESDWIVGEAESTFRLGQDKTSAADLDEQTLYDQTQLEVENQRSFNFSSVDVSSQCSVTESVDVPSGVSVVTEACNNDSFTGDWITGESSDSTRYVSGSVILGEGISERFEARQSVAASNVRSNTDLEVGLDSLLEQVPDCSLENSSTQRLPASQESQFEFYKSCSPGQHLNRTPVTKTETSQYFKYSIDLGFEISSNLTEEEDIRYAAKKEWLDNWNNRDPPETEAFVNGRDQDISISEEVIDDEEYVVIEIGDMHGNSSLHKGTHEASLNYYETKNPGSTSGTSGSAGGSLVGGGEEQLVENVSSDEYNWSVSIISTEDTQSYQVSGYPGASFENFVVLRNTGDSNVTLDVECVDLGEACDWVDVDVDQVTLDRNSFTEKVVTVQGEVPESFSDEDAPASFSIKVSDPRSDDTGSNGVGVEYVDFTVTHDPFLGPALDTALKLFDWREVESPVSWGNPIPYPFVFLPLLLTGLFWSAWWVVEYVSPMKKRPDARAVVSVGVFLLLFILL